MKVKLDSYSSLFYIALTMLLNKNENSIFPEILYILEPEQVLQVVDMFEGQTIQVPTRQELAVKLQSALVAYYIYCEGKTPLSVSQELSIDGNEMRSIKATITSYLEFINKNGLIPPNLLSGCTDVNSNKLHKQST